MFGVQAKCRDCRLPSCELLMFPTEMLPTDKLDTLQKSSRSILEC